uniref:RING-type domain-containing protein n=1 Tax=Ditylenchus dipsaci TaxID=166011 RepID=A0A915EJR7_9BILA
MNHNDPVHRCSHRANDRIGSGVSARVAGSRDDYDSGNMAADDCLLPKLTFFTRPTCACPCLFRNFGQSCSLAILPPWVLMSVESQFKKILKLLVILQSLDQQHPSANFDAVASEVRRLANSASSTDSVPISSRTRSRRPFMLPESSNIHAQGISQVIIRFDSDGFAFQSRGGIHSVMSQVGEDVPVGISPECLARMPMVEVSEKQVDDAAQCVTCMDNFKVNEKVARLDCEHIYHQQCIMPWLRLHNTCPLCRSVVDPVNWKNREDKKEKKSSSQIILKTSSS